MPKRPQLLRGRLHDDHAVQHAVYRELVARGNRLDDGYVTPNDRANRLSGAAQK